MFRPSILVITLLLALHAAAQPGTNDPTFNVSDDGTWGDGPDGPVYHAVQQSDGRIIIIGNFTDIHTTASNRIARMNLDGSIDGSFDVGSGFSNEYPQTPATVALQPDGRILVGGGFLSYDGISRTRLVRLLPDGSVDASFDPGSGPDGRVWDIELLPDGRIMIVGDFMIVQGAARPRVARLLSDGALDPSFAPLAGADDLITSVAVQSDGKAILGGTFTSVQGVPRSCIARLNVNGTLDASFDPGSGVQGIAPDDFVGPRVDGVAVQPDGNIVAVGSFSTYNGVARGCITRILATGAIDPLFDPLGGSTRSITSCDLRVDGQILVAGLFMDYGGRSGVALLNVDGSMDPSFITGFHTNTVEFAINLGGYKVLVGGGFNSFSSDPPISSLEMLLPDGSTNWTFHRGSGFNASPRDMLVLPDNSILVAGGFTRFNGSFVPKVVRLTEDGEFDPTYPVGSGPNGTVRGMARLADGRVVIHGDFTQVDGVPRAGIARLNADGSLDLSFNPGTGVSPPAFDDILDMSLLDDGRVLIAGEFDAVDGVPRTGIARLLASGGVDPAFAPVLAGAFDPIVHALSVGPAPDNLVTIAGSFSSVNGTTRNRLARVTQSGVLDLTFDAGTGTAGGSVLGMARTPADELLVFGYFSAYNDVDVDGLVRLLPDGELDAAFTPPELDHSEPFDLIVLPTGQIVLGGEFLLAGATDDVHLLSLLPSGFLDPAFAPGEAEYRIDRLAFQPNCCAGKILVAGPFTDYNGITRHRIARVHNDEGVRMIGRAFLEGPWAGTFMNANLGPAGMLPTQEPFSGLGFQHVGDGGGEQTSQSVFMQQGPDAIVDWIMVELRNPQNTTQVFATRSALLKADGSIVDMDGQSFLKFNAVGNGIYYVSIRHRNHLGVMTQQPQLLLYIGSFVDFTSPNLALFGTDAMKVIGNDRMLWAGDVNQDGELKYTGQFNDRDPILVSIGGNVPTNSVSGYKLEDVNLDGVVKYTGQFNDRDPILVNIGGNVPTNVRQAQLP